MPHRLEKLLIVLLALGNVRAQSIPGIGLDPSKDIVQYSRQSWLRKDGLPQNSVQAIAHTADGYLWLGTEEGLVRFDGVAFTTFNIRNTPELKSNNIMALLESSDGRLWIGTSGGGLTSCNNGLFTSYAAEEKLARASVRAICEENDGKLWLGTSIGLLSFTPSSTKKVHTTEAWSQYEGITGVCKDSSGTLLVATMRGVLTVRDTCLSPHPLLRDGGKPIPARTLLVDHAGDIWVGSSNRGVYRLHAGALSHFTAKNGLASDVIQCVYEDRWKTLWIGTRGGGLIRLRGNDISSFNSSDGLSGDNVVALHEDREGNLWVGTVGAGLNRLTNGRFATYPTGETPAENMIWSVYEDRAGTVWAGNEAGQVLQLRGNRFVPDGILSNGHTGGVTTLFMDRESAMWIGTNRGLYRIKNRQVQPVSSMGINAICEDSRGTLWFGSPFGIGSFEGGKFTVRSYRDTDPSLSDVRCIHEDRNGNLWIGTGHGLRRFSGGIATTPVMPAALSSSDIMAMHEDNDGVLWFGTMGAGLMRISPVAYEADSVPGASTITSANGLFDDTIYKILEDDNQNFWMSSNNGVFRVSRNDLNEFVEGKTTSVSSMAFGLSDGMRSDECNGGTQSAGCKSHDGKLWFPTTSGVVMVDPHDTLMGSVAPIVIVERVRIDRRIVTMANNIELPAGNGDLEFVYTGLSFAAPRKVRFKVKLEGFNNEWIDAGSRRWASYTNIPPGRYTFRVISGFDEGVWNEQGASFSFTLSPHFYQTTWFYLLCVTIIGAVALGGHLLYRRDRNRELLASQLESQLAQAQLQVLKMQLDPHFLFNTLNGIMALIQENPQAAQRTVARLSEFLRLTLENSGVQEVPMQKELEFLDRYLQIEQLRFGDRLTVQQDVDPATLGGLVPSLILQPLVENAIKHGVAERRGPATILIQAARDDGRLVIHVRDNGGGIPSTPQEGIGLTNTRQRLQRLYGDEHVFELSSLEGGGVDVLLSIPYHEQGVFGVRRG